MIESSRTITREMSIDANPAGVLCIWPGDTRSALDHHYAVWTKPLARRTLRVSLARSSG